MRESLLSVLTLSTLLGCTRPLLSRHNSFKRLAVIPTNRTEGTMEVLIERQRGEQNGHWTRVLARANEDLGGGEEGGIDLARVS